MLCGGNFLYNANILDGIVELVINDERTCKILRNMEIKVRSTTVQTANDTLFRA